MAWQLVFTEQYTRRAARFLRKHPQLASQYEKTLLLLEANPHHPSLRLHALQGRLAGLHSVSINLSYRITLELVITESEIVPINVGSHDEVYGG
ncbi:MAG: plasmid stabilization protein [Betaproteobacteria bacterium]|jgi:toxin HigB-1|nr:plasmid stabilization protein [Betaproteobacteria bacterium]